MTKVETKDQARNVEDHVRRIVGLVDSELVGLPDDVAREVRRRAGQALIASDLNTKTAKAFRLVKAAVEGIRKAAAERASPDGAGVWTYPGLDAVIAKAAGELHDELAAVDSRFGERTVDDVADLLADEPLNCDDVHVRRLIVQIGRPVDALDLRTSKPDDAPETLRKRIARAR